jgi:hypothetical protein
MPCARQRRPRVFRRFCRGRRPLTVVASLPDVLAGPAVVLEDFPPAFDDVLESDKPRGAALGALDAVEHTYLSMPKIR